ncbi:MAG: hypothetical protein JST52_07275 [Bacteroidetes bacterium]|nr:hypothetical protein [Bacteroidota bacterium]MBS1738917.1 hypothetical protein [Bacteroidota bacterium]MBS1776570.1 hypothetical protein [Bacteroidota bacterium]
MKFWKHTLITAFAFLGVCSTVLYTSCEKDSCSDLKCRNGGACADGFCRCQTGYEGTQCETLSATKFVGRFVGHFTCPGSAPAIDTVDIWMKQPPSTVFFVDRGNMADTLSGTVSGTDLFFATTTIGNAKHYTRAEIIANKISVFTESILDTNSGAPIACSFVGFK